MKKLSDSLVDGFFDLIYSPKKNIERWVLVLFVVGFILRLIAALHEGFFADDAIYASQSAYIFQAKILSTHSHPPLFSYLTDLAYTIFGYTTLAARFFPLVAGSLLIIVSYLLVKELLGAKVALATAFFVTFSNFLIRMTFTEHTLVTLFFVALGLYTGLIYLKSNKLSFLIGTAALFGLGCLTKYNSAFFVLAFCIFSLYHFKTHKKAAFTKKNLKHLLLLGAIIVLFSLPFLLFNLFIYQDKGIADFQFTRIFKPEAAQQLLGNLAGQDKSFVQSLFTLGNYANVKLVPITDLCLFLFALFGFFLMIKKKEKYALAFVLISLLIPFVLQSAGSALGKHFAFLHFFLAIPAGFALEAIYRKISGSLTKLLFIGALLAILIINLGSTYNVPQTYWHESGTSELKSYLNDQVAPNDLIVFDSRIYTAISYWLGTDHNLLETNQFREFLKADATIPAERKAGVKVYFVECAIDDCGWGWVSQKQDFNESTEQLFESVRNTTSVSETIRGRRYSGNEFFTKPEKFDEYQVYEANLLLSPELVKKTKMVDNFYFVPYLYANMDNYVFAYEPAGLRSPLTSLSLGIIYASVFLSIILMIITPFLLLMDLTSKRD